MMVCWQRLSRARSWPPSGRAPLKRSAVKKRSPRSAFRLARSQEGESEAARKITRWRWELNLSLEKAALIDSI